MKTSRIYAMKNREIAAIFEEVAIYLQMQDEVIFKVRAYENAALALEGLAEDVEDIYKRGGIAALQEIPSIGRALAEKIEEYIKTNKMEFYDELRKKLPIDLKGLRNIEGMGPRKILVLYKKLRVKDVDDLKKSAEAGKIRSLAGFGEKSEANILKAIAIKEKSRGRMPLFEADPIVAEIVDVLSRAGAEQITAAGSYRRRKETIGDIDLLVVSNKPGKIMDAFTKMKSVIAVYAKGTTKSTVRLMYGLDADLRIVERSSFGAALNYFTGSKDHNVALRKISIFRGMKLNEYGLYKGKKQVAGENEEGLYKALGLRYIEPELRENSGEIEASKKNTLPNLIGYSDLAGDLQVQTSWTDGSSSIEDMARAASKIGLEYIAITDHTKSLAMTGGLDEKKLAKQGEEIDKISEKLGNIAILKGAEVNIMKDGTLDIASAALRKLDVVGAAVHSNFALSKDQMTRRLIRAIENPDVDVLFHPTGRIVGKREPYDIDIEQVVDAAKSSGTVLEIDSLERLDMKDEHIRLAVRRGVKLCIDSDAHSPSHFSALRFGLAQARRGWASKKDVINAWPLEKMQKMLK